MNWNKAYLDAKKLLNCPTNRGLMTRCEKSNEQIGFWTRQAREQAELEADLAQVDGVKEMAWIPKIQKVPAKGLQVLEGHYELKVKRKSGEIELIIASTDWVEINFKASVLGVLQRIAYKKLEILDVTAVDMTESERQGFISVEKLGVTCSPCDTRIVNRLKYKRKTQRKEVTLPHQWLGYCDDSKEYIKLEEEWVKSNFDAAYLDQVKCCCRSKTPFLKIPPGKNRSHTNRCETGGPPIHYQQKMGERTCMVYSMASALHYCGHKDEAACIRNRAKQYVFNKRAFVSFVINIKKEYKVLRRWSKTKVETFNALGPLGGGLFLTQLLGGDGKHDHCVVITDKWIFDSNFGQALARSKDSLNSCCSSDQVSSEFVGVVAVEHFPGVQVP